MENFVVNVSDGGGTDVVRLTRVVEVRKNKTEERESVLF